MTIRLPSTLVLALCMTLCAVLPARGVTVIQGYFAFDYVTGLDRPTSITFGPSDELYVAGLDGTIRVVRDLGGDGFADTTSVFQSGFVVPLGTAWHNGSLFVSSLGIVTRVTDTDADWVADTVDTLITGIPFGSHQNNGLTIGPDGLLYLCVGSQSESGYQPPWSASILRFTDTGVFLGAYATGFRNPYDLTFVQGVPYTTDNSPGADSTSLCFEAPDELNRVLPGGDYGFPDCFGVGDCADLSGICSPPPCGPGDCEFNGGCTAGMTYPLVHLDPHSAPTGISHGGGFEGFQDTDLFITQFGQGVPVPSCPTDFGHNLVHVDLAAGGGATAEEFATGFSAPTDVVVGPDSSLYVSDFATGIVHRIFRTSAGAVGGSTPLPAALSLSPNPARTRAVIGLPEADGPRSIRVFDITGRLVAELDGERADPVWDLQDDDGRRVAGGLYLVRVRSGRSLATAKLLVLD